MEGGRVLPVLPAWRAKCEARRVCETHCGNCDRSPVAATKKAKGKRLRDVIPGVSRTCKHGEHRHTGCVHCGTGPDAAFAASQLYRIALRHQERDDAYARGLMDVLINALAAGDPEAPKAP